jgi:hypothetical protein
MAAEKISPGRVTRTVPWIGPARPGDQVFYLAINDRYCAHPHGSVKEDGWVFVAHEAGEMATINRP